MQNTKTVTTPNNICVDIDLPAEDTGNMIRWEWNDYKTNPPKHSGEYLCLLDGEIYQAEFYEEDEDEAWGDAFDPEFWMPLPPMPDKKTKRYMK